MITTKQNSLVTRLLIIVAMLVGTISAIRVQPVRAATDIVNINQSSSRLSSETASVIGPGEINSFESFLFGTLIKSLDDNRVDSNDISSSFRAFVLDNPILVLNGLSPLEKKAGDGDFTLTLNGAEFVPDSKAFWNETELYTSFIGSTQLNASIPAYFILNEGTANISVKNPAPGGGTSSSLVFTISPRTSTWMYHSPEGGIVWDLDVADSDPLTIYAATSAGGVFKSVNGGESWFAVNNGIATSSVSSVAVHPTNPSIVFVGGESSGEGIYKTIDGGTFWAKILITPNVTTIKFDPQNPNSVYAATGAGLYRSNDGGTTWQDIVGTKLGDFPSSYILDIAIDGDNPGTIYALNSPVNNGDRSVWKTTNGGNTWIQLTKDANGIPASILRSIEIDPSNPSVLYAGTEYRNDSSEVGLYKTENGGMTWTRIISDENYYFEIVFNKGNPDYIYVSTSADIYKSSDGGLNWQPLSPSADTMTIDADPTNASVVYGGGYHGLVKSSDGGATWISINTGLYAHLITALAYGSQNASLFATAWTGGIWRSTDYGASWNYLGLNNSYLDFLVMDPNHSDHILVGFGSSFFESIDAGQSWTQRSLDAPINAITFASNSDLYYGRNDVQIHKSTDDGATWVSKSTGLPTCLDTCWFSFLAADPVDQNLIYAGLQSGTYTAMGWTVTGSIYKTSNGGDNWIKIGNGITTSYLETLAVDPLNRSTLYIGTYNGIFKSTDGGANWFKSGNALSYLQVNAIAVDPENNQIVYAGTEGQGVYRSLDGGATWEGFNYGIASGYVRGIVAIPSTAQKQASSLSESQVVSASSQLNKIYSISGGQVNAYFEEYTTFRDVADTHWAWDYIERLYNAGVTGGCSTNPLSYCPENSVTRAQMAIFLEKGVHYPSAYSPPNIAPTFTDTAGHWAEDWIEALRIDGITGGCGPNLYCPESPVTRAQMAVFLLKAKHGKSYALPAVGASTGFTDVPTTHWAAPWIKQLAAEGITGGCGAGIYCPESPVTRAQMAVFLVRTFNLP